ncbi:DUF4864 domain-containing protein [Granulosicoccus sp. 3-233]|uniref:DUF4864 domain-containing protein n=1 Tax=Granulosicoccus sp. 3-233 TaxID=3417969 RepID=UPI003D352133
MALQASLATADTAIAAPDREHAPEQVVSIIIGALQSNDPASDSGIATVYRFASPANRASTGPLARFSNMIKRGFPDMLNHVRARYTPMQVQDDQALQAVWLSTPDGRENGYGFQLSRQRGGEFDGMWMTDAVIPLGPGAQSGIRI